MGILPGYIWSATTDGEAVQVNIYLYTTARRSISVPQGGNVQITMQSEMPWTGSVSMNVEIPESTTVLLRLPIAEWMIEPKVGHIPGSLFELY
jgi:DUF1680 family protein